MTDSFVIHVWKVQKLVTFLSHFTFINIRTCTDNQWVMLFYCVLKKYSPFVAICPQRMLFLIHDTIIFSLFPPI